MTRGIKRTRRTEIVTHDPSTIDQNELQLTEFPNLGSDDVIIPGTVILSFNTELSSKADRKRTLVSNLDRAIVKTLSVKFDGNVILTLMCLHATENRVRKAECSEIRYNL